MEINVNHALTYFEGCTAAGVAAQDLLPEGYDSFDAVTAAALTDLTERISDVSKKVMFCVVGCIAATAAAVAIVAMTELLSVAALFSGIALLAGYGAYLQNKEITRLDQLQVPRDFLQRMEACHKLKEATEYVLHQNERVVTVKIGEHNAYLNIPYNRFNQFVRERIDIAQIVAENFKDHRLSSDVWREPTADFIRFIDRKPDVTVTFSGRTDEDKPFDVTNFVLTR